MKRFIIAIPLLMVALLALTWSNQSAATEPGAITGNVYCDMDMNGACDCEEGGLGDIHIQIFAEHCGGAALQTVSTDEHGNFAFQGFEPGTYFVMVDLDYVCGGRVPTTKNCRQIQLAAGEALNLPPFGFSDYGQ